MRPRKTVAVVVAALVAAVVAGPVTPALAAPTPVPTPTPEPPLPGRGPGGVPVGGARLGSVGIQLPAGAPRLPRDISARGWVLADLDTGDVLAARDAHGRFPPASTLKWLTAVTLLPQLTDRTRKVTVSYADVNVDGTRVGLVEHGHYTIDLLFQAMMMASGNDAANALARVAGSVPRTVAAMNAKAAALQAYDTHAATPSGLDGPHQLTSAYDLALIARAGLARPDFRRYTARTRGKIPAQGTRYKAFEFANDNKLLYNYPGAFGGKNGFTDAAHHSFIGAAKKGNRRLIVTFMYGEHKPDNISVQAGRMLDWGFSLPRTLAPVGTLVSPAVPGSTPSATPGAPAPSAPAVAAVGQDTTGGSTRPLWLLGGGLVALVLLGWGAITLARRP
ncbi:MAG TPA: serine hydrolase [Mycobacteriales bacterium]|nr:serine hydrolase [Mycobacteriales bacterium]